MKKLVVSFLFTLFAVASVHAKIDERGFVIQVDMETVEIESSVQFIGGCHDFPKCTDGDPPPTSTKL